MRRRSGFFVFLVAALLLAACAGPSPQPTNTPAPPSATPLPDATATPVPTLYPTEAARDTRLYQHPTGVFQIAVPNDWTAVDTSTRLRLLVQFIPALGYGSRVTVEVTNEGPLRPEDVQSLAESYARLTYGSNPDYTRINEAELPDGRLQYVYLYNDQRGGAGRETLYIQQVGPYFTALRLFLANQDTATLSRAMESVAGSLTVDPLVVWGTEETTVGAADLPLDNPFVWRDQAGSTHITGQVTNRSPYVVTGVTVQAALCNPQGIIVAQPQAAPVLDRIYPAGSSPFEVVAENVAEDASLCSLQATGTPITPDESYVNTLTLTPQVGFDALERLAIQGTATNPGPQTLNNLEVILVVYDTDDHVVGLEVIPYGPGTLLEPDQAVSFDYTFEELGGEAYRYLALAQATAVSADATPTGGP